MPPANVFLIRHAEEPGSSFAGIKTNGHADEESLTVRGWQRAGAWTVLFSSPSLLGPLGLRKPESIFAAVREAHDGGSGS